jgi:hypothetical protein
MISEDAFVKMALSFPGTGQGPHFDRIGFKVLGKRMFTTYLAKNNTANIFLTPTEQRVFCKMIPKPFIRFPINGVKRGRQLLNSVKFQKKY